MESEHWREFTGEGRNLLSCGRWIPGLHLLEDTPDLLLSRVAGRENHAVPTLPATIYNR
jgi:hypothetical protein